MGIMSLRLDRETDRRIDQLARRRGISRSAVIRTAVSALAEQEKEGGTPFETMAHLIGCVRGGPIDLSKATGKGFRALLERKKGRR
jgi:Arc/MetJ-type ribon-helix-helix transcriptional regulator